jgi:hypothetical protein
MMGLVKDFRWKFALLICPELKADVSEEAAIADTNLEPIPHTVPKEMSSGRTQRETLIYLAEEMAAHLGVTHYAISMRALGKGDFFKNMIEKGYDCRTRTASKLMSWFSDNWPEELEWPSDIPRPGVETASYEAAVQEIDREFALKLDASRVEHAKEILKVIEVIQKHGLPSDDDPAFDALAHKLAPLIR